MALGGRKRGKYSCRWRHASWQAGFSESARSSGDRRRRLSVVGARGCRSHWTRSGPCAAPFCGCRRRPGRERFFIFSPRPSRFCGSSASSPCVGRYSPQLFEQKEALAPCSSVWRRWAPGNSAEAGARREFDAPVLDRSFVGELAGFIEEVDPRIQGVRFLLRLSEAQGLPPQKTPYRVRLTTRGAQGLSAGDFVIVKARLLPPPHASLPGGYDFARDAYFARIGAVGNVLGSSQTVDPPEAPGWSLSFFAAVDRARNTLALRVANAIGGDNGAIGAAMVTGKRDLLSDAARETIRKAGIFHIITISGVQMTLVAGIFFVGLRRLLALSTDLALNYPIKKWAAALAMLAACLYGLFTGSRVGSERALFMTLILLGSVLADRPALTMRNLAFAALAVIALEPEALLGASFQLSFAAVAALVAVFESRISARSNAKRVAAKKTPESRTEAETEARSLAENLAERSRHGILGALFATFCATSATASFMAYDFHELSPYVLIGNPLTLAMIEFFAVPAALVGALLYPFGLDNLVWTYLGAGINLIMVIAERIGSAPGASIALPAFAPWSLACLTLAVLSAVLWRTWTLRLTALPLLALGLLGAASGGHFDLAVSPTGDMAALRDAGGQLTILGKKRDLSPRSSGCAPTPILALQLIARDVAIRSAVSACCAMAKPPRWCWRNWLSTRIARAQKS